MEITEIAVNPSNLHRYNPPTGMVDLGCASISAWAVNGKELDACLEAHMTLNSYVEDQTSSDDAGGKYASWLNSMGFEHQSDEGWWNEIAVTPENIQAFVQTYKDAEFDERVQAAIERYSRKKFTHNMTLVSEFVEVFS